MNSATLALFTLAVKASLVLAAGFVAAAGAARASAAARHRLWSLVLLGLLLLPVAQGILPPLSLRWLPVRAIASGANTSAALAATEPIVRATSLGLDTSIPASARPPFRRPALDRCILAFWLAGFILLLARLFADVWQLRRLLRGAIAAPAMAAEAAGIAARIGLRRAVAVMSTGAIRVPQASGVFRRVILVPSGFTTWPEDRRRLVLAHELAHLRRSDSFWLWVARTASAVYWWNPLVWLACRRQYLAGEQACDDRAVAIAEAEGLRPADYVGHLLAVARSLIGDVRRPFPVASAMARGPFLEERVRAILDDSRPRHAGAALVALIAILACSGFLPLAAVRVSRANRPTAAAQAQQRVQAPPAAPAFDAASIKSLGPTNGVHVHENGDPGHLNFSGTLHDFIIQAYGIDNNSQLTGEPAWFHSEIYAIAAVTGHPADNAQQMLMLRTLLADRFQLRLRTENRELDAYNLTVAPGGPKFKELPPDAPEPKNPDEPDGTFARAFESVTQMVAVLNHRYGGRIQLDRPVVDRTGLTGRYNIVLRTDIVVENPDTPLRTVATPNLDHDIESELGLRLVPGRAPFTCYVVIGASQPTAN